MAQPVRDLSGAKQVLDKYIGGRAFHGRVQASTVQATLKNKDRVVFEASEESRHPFILLAVITERVNERISEFLQSKLPVAVQKALSRQGASSSESPLLRAFLHVCSSYKKVSAYGESIFAYTETAAVLLDVLSRRLYCVNWGAEAASSLVVVSSDGEAQRPHSAKQHYYDQHMIQEITFWPADQQYHAIIGSAGLWQHLHPAKAGLHAAVYAAAPELSTPSAHHDPASAVVRAALRSITDRCATSPHRRTAVLDSISQLNRLRSGSRAEGRKHSILPRMRGDIHPDLTAAVLSLRLHSSTSSSAPFSLFSLMKPRSCSDLPSMKQATPPSEVVKHRRCFVGRCSQRDVRDAHSQARSTSGTSSPSVGLKRVAPLMMHSLEDNSDSVSAHVTSPTASSSQQVAASDAHRPSGGALDDVQRRWQLLQAHTQTLTGERMLRRSMWGSAVSLALSNLTETSSIGRCGSSGSLQAEQTDAAGRRESVRHAGTEVGWAPDSSGMNTTSSESGLQSLDRALAPASDGVTDARIPMLKAPSDEMQRG